jgi:hypothetical protein
MRRRTPMPTANATSGIVALSELVTNKSAYSGKYIWVEARPGALVMWAHPTGVPMFSVLLVSPNGNLLAECEYTNAANSQQAKWAAPCIEWVIQSGKATDTILVYGRYADFGAYPGYGTYLSNGRLAAFEIVVGRDTFCVGGDSSNASTSCPKPPTF